MFIEDNQLGIYKISTAMAAAWYVFYRLFNKNNDAANDQSDEVQGYKKKRHTPLSAEIHKIFTTYLSPEPVEENNDPRTPRNRHNLERQLFHAGFKLDVESPSRRLENFKSWACKMTVRENQLIEKKSGKLIVSIEDFPDVIRKAHCDDQTGLHLDLPATIEKIKERFTFGHRNFGMNEATVKEELNKCNHPICKPIFKQYRKAKKMGQADATTSRQSFCQDAHNVHSDMSLTSLTPVTLEERNVESSSSLTSLTPLTMDKSLQPLSIMSSATSAQSSPSLTSLAPVTMGKSLQSLSIISSATSAQSSPSLTSLAPVTMAKVCNLCPLCPVPPMPSPHLL
ncbi:uncharacterized protein LOC106159315 [Lingula anatina]|uniref:Uncharacterized protein LOC106159315 n=1 Tax=Lingula anatina TaxID=7574 RepID=A0A1S3HZN0_LINAN|nr:uncharacterized protein LOC106159315 [Lingula anatina]|eukprot:XP_013391026.1 uncharacterized protein LOC106159315 [Lingula anatina]